MVRSAPLVLGARWDPPALAAPWRRLIHPRPRVRSARRALAARLLRRLQPHPPVLPVLAARSRRQFHPRPLAPSDQSAPAVRWHHRPHPRRLVRSVLAARSLRRPHPRPPIPSVQLALVVPSLHPLRPHLLVLSGPVVPWLRLHHRLRLVPLGRSVPAVRSLHRHQPRRLAPWVLLALAAQLLRLPPPVRSRRQCQLHPVVRLALLAQPDPSAPLAPSPRWRRFLRSDPEGRAIRRNRVALGVRRARLRPAGRGALVRRAVRARRAVRSVPRGREILARPAPPARPVRQAGRLVPRCLWLRQHPVHPVRPDLPVLPDRPGCPGRRGPPRPVRSRSAPADWFWSIARRFLLPRPHHRSHRPCQLDSRCSRSPMAPTFHPTRSLEMRTQTPASWAWGDRCHSIHCCASADQRVRRRASPRPLEPRSQTRTTARLANRELGGLVGEFAPRARAGARAQRLRGSTNLPSDRVAADSAMPRNHELHPFARSAWPTGWAVASRSVRSDGTIHHLAGQVLCSALRPRLSVWAR